MTFKELAKKLKITIQNVPNLIDVLSEGFEEVETTAVEVTTVYQDGTKLATIKVDDTEHDIFTPFIIAPYSETEHKVGIWYHDNIAEDVYERTIIKENLHFDNSMAIIDSTITTATIKDIIAFNGSAVTADRAGFTSLCGLPGMNHWVFGIHVNINGLGLYGSAASAMEGGKAICTIRYTKPTE